MKSNLSRRELMKAAGAIALAPSLAAAQKASWPPAAGTGTPKICLGVRPDLDEAGMRRVKQIGVDYVLMADRRFRGPKKFSANG